MYLWIVRACHSNVSSACRSITERYQLFSYHVILGFPGGSVVKNPSDNAGAVGDAGSMPGVGRSPGVGNGISPPVFLPGKFHGERSIQSMGSQRVSLSD